MFYQPFDKRQKLNETTQVQKFRFDLTDNMDKVIKIQRAFMDARQELIEFLDEIDKLLDKLDKMVKTGKADEEYKEVLQGIHMDAKKIMNNIYEDTDVKDSLDSISNKLFKLKKIKERKKKEEKIKHKERMRRNKEIAKGAV